MPRNRKQTIYAVYIDDPATGIDESLGDKVRLYRNLKDARGALFETLIDITDPDGVEFNPEEQEFWNDKGKKLLESKELWPINEAGEPHDEWPVSKMEHAWIGPQVQGEDGIYASLYEWVLN